MNRSVRILALVYIALTALFVGYLGTIWAFFPSDHLPKLGITVTELHGINTLKSIMATGLLGLAACCILFLMNQQVWYRPLVLLAAIMLTVRVSSLIFDGFHARMAIYAVLELLIVIAAWVGAKRA